MNICIYKHNPRVEVTLKILESYEEAFLRLGHKVMFLSYDMQNYTPLQARAVAQEFLDFNADIALCYGFSAMPEVNGSFFFRKRNIPLIVLCFENPFFGLSKRILDEIKAHPDYYLFFVWDTCYLDLLRRYVKRCFPIRHAARMPTDHNVTNRKIDFQHEVAFVGNIPGKSATEYGNLGDESRIDILVDEFICRKLLESRMNIIQFLEGSKSKNPKNGMLEKPLYHQGVIYPMYADGLAKYRRAVLNELEMFNIDCYGDSVWDAPHIRFHGPVSYERELAKVYGSSLVNIDIPAFQSIDSVNNRVFDAGVVNALVLTESKPDLKGVFEDSEAIEYRSIYDLREKIEFYLNNGSAREDVAEKLHISIRDRHTYRHRVEYIEDVLLQEGIL